MFSVLCSQCACGECFNESCQTINVLDLTKSLNTDEMVQSLAIASANV